MLDEELKNRVFINCGEVNIEIVKLENNIPDKRTKEYLEWKEKFNYLCGKYNEMVDDKIYKLI